MVTSAKGRLVTKIRHLIGLVRREDELGRRTRYVIVRVVSRGGEVPIYIGIIYVYGQISIPFAFATAAIFQYLVDFFGQKLWVYRNPDVTPKMLFTEFVGYMLIRLAVLSSAAGLVYTLTEIFKMKAWVAIAIMISIFLPLCYFLYRRVFVRG